MLQTFRSLVSKVFAVPGHSKNPNRDTSGDIYSVTYTMTDRGTCVIDIWSSDAEMSSTTLAGFMAFVLSDECTEETLSVIRESVEGRSGPEAFQAFFQQFTEIIEENSQIVEPTEQGEGPLIDPREVM